MPWRDGEKPNFLEMGLDYHQVVLGECPGKTGLEVNGDNVVIHGVAVEHTTTEDQVIWNGHNGEMYFYQCELPYDVDKFHCTGFRTNGTGFITALFVHLIDSILCLDKARRQSQQQQKEDDLDMKQLDRHTQYILRWIRHILSRAFHMHFDKSVAIFIPKIDQSVVIKPPLQTETTAVATDTMSEQPADEKIFTPQPIDLKKKGRKKWTQNQLEYMQRPLDYSPLQDMGFPLNSTCDRILSHHQELDSGTAVRELKQHLEDITGNERVVFMGIYGQQGAASEDSYHGISGSTFSTCMVDNPKPP